MTTTTTRPTTVEALVGAVLPLLARLREAGEVPVTDDADAERLIRKAFTDRRGPLRQRESLTKPTRDESAFGTASRFHSGRNMGLWGPVGASLGIGRERYDALDSVACVVWLVLRGRSVGSDAWRRALGA
jgi:hypothetical protein